MSFHGKPLASNGADAKVSSTAHYVSREDQIKFLKENFEPLERFFKNYKSSKESKTLQALSNAILLKDKRVLGKNIDAGKGQLAATVLAHLENLYKNFLKKVGQGPENNLLLKEYLKEVKATLEVGRILMRKVEVHHAIKKSSGELNDFLEAQIPKAQSQVDLLDKTIYPTIYCLRIPTKDFDKLRAHISAFQFNETSGLAVDMLKGTASILVGLAAVATGSTYAPGGGGGEYTMNCLGLNGNIPSRWIESSFNELQLTRRYREDEEGDIVSSYMPGDTIKVIRESRNNQFVKHNGGVTTLYTVDARSVNDLFENGTRFHLAADSKDSKGRAVLFTSLEDAYLFAQANKRNNRFDPIGGWRQYRDWNDVERSALRSAVLKAVPTAAPESAPAAAPKPSAAAAVSAQGMFAPSTNYDLTAHATRAPLHSAAPKKKSP